MRSKTILVAGDEGDIRSCLSASLQRLGYAVKVAHDENEILNGLRGGSAGVGVVVLDFAGLAGRGMETLRQIRELERDLPVIILLPGGSVRAAETSASEATQCLERPFSIQVLMDAIREVMPPVNGTGAIPGGTSFFCAGRKMRKIRELLQQLGRSDVPVVFQGESGTGKEVLARELHATSPRAGKPLVKLNCAALPTELLESELFGYERGAFTGALRSTPGKFEIADGGTLLLDEIGDMDLRLQAKLLHVLQDWEFYPLGAKKPVRVNVRVLAATHRDLEKAVWSGQFREDLYYRLNVVAIEVPPLRRRKEEILPLMRWFLEQHRLTGQPTPEITPALQEALLAHDWPGNVRELENAARKLLVFGDTDLLAEELQRRRVAAQARGDQESGVQATLTLPALPEVDRKRRQSEGDVIRAALRLTNWNRRKAASMLKIDYKGLLYRMKKLGIGRVSGGDLSIQLEDLPTGLPV